MQEYLLRYMYPLCEINATEELLHTSSLCL